MDGKIKYLLSKNIDISSDNNGGYIILNSNDGEYYHLDDTTAYFLDSIIAGMEFDNFCYQISHKPKLFILQTN